jgi:hypothetical protein
MSTRDVDVVIAVHDPRRPIERAVGSALSNTAALRVTVVVHDTDPTPIEHRLGQMLDDPRVRVAHHADGVPSAAGPFNHGLEMSDAAFTAVMGSDDEVQAGAVDSWLRLARRDGADVVVARVRYARGPAVATPVTRPLHRRGLDPVRDRLAYRSAPLGLVSRARFGDLRFATGLAVGEDLSYVSRLWFSGARVAYDRRGPAYLVHDDGAERVTMATRSIATEFSYLDAVLDPWFDALDAAQRSALVVKFLRVHVFGAVYNRRDERWWTTAERSALASVASRLMEVGGGIQRVLSRRDRALLDLIVDVDAPVDMLIAAAIKRRSFAHPAALIPRHLPALLHREAPLRFAAASALQLV